jgi:NTP pyrophosphatase (non-canonical NTP hydrolase)
MSDADKLRDASPWQPMRDPLELAFLGKLLEEVNELGAAISRCIIQGIDEREPVTGKPNREWLEDEVADVAAGVQLVGEHFNLDLDRIERRIDRKKAHLRQWHRHLGGDA